MKTSRCVICIILLLFLQSCGSKGKILTSEIDLEDISLNWRAIDIQDYLQGKYCLEDIKLNEDGEQIEFRYAPVYYKGIQGSFIYEIHKNGNAYSFSAPVNLYKFFGGKDTNGCGGIRTLPTELHFNKIKEEYKPLYESNWTYSTAMLISDFRKKGKQLFLTFTKSTDSTESKIFIMAQSMDSL